MNLEDCKADCEGDLDCHFIFHNINGSCQLYRVCDNTRVVNTVGETWIIKAGKHITYITEPIYAFAVLKRYVFLIEFSGICFFCIVGCLW